MPQKYLNTSTFAPGAKCLVPRRTAAPSGPHDRSFTTLATTHQTGPLASAVGTVGMLAMPARGDRASSRQSHPPTPIESPLIVERTDVERPRRRTRDA